MPFKSINFKVLRNALIALYLLFSLSQVHGQLDSVVFVNVTHTYENSESDSVKLKSIYQLLNHHHLESEREKVFNLTLEAINLSKQIKDTSSLRNLYSRWINRMWDVDTTTYKTNYKEAISFLKNNNFKKEYLRCLVSHSSYLAAMRQYDESFIVKDEAIQLATEMKDSVQLGGIYYDLGETNLDFQDYNKAMESYVKAKNFYSGKFSWSYHYATSGLLDAYYGLYKKSKNPDLLASMEKECQILAKPFNEGKRDDFLLQYKINSEICISLIKGRTDNLNFMVSQLEDLSKKFDYSPLSSTYEELTNYYERAGRFQNATKYLLKSIELNKKAKPLPKHNELISNYKTLSEIQYKIGNFKNAHDFVIKARNLKDSLGNIQYARNLKDLEVKYGSLEKEQENKQLSLKNELLSQRNKYYLLGLLGFILLSIISFFAYFKINRARGIISKQRDELLESNKIQDRLFSIIGHDLRKPILGIQGVGKKLAYLNETGEKKLLDQLLTSMDYNSKNLMILINNLLSWTKFQKGNKRLNKTELNVEDIINENTSFFEEILKIKNINLKLKKSNLVVSSNFEALSTIVRNILDNSIKYSEEFGQIEIILEKNLIQINDYGIGMDQATLNRIKENSAGTSMTGTHGEMGVGLGWQIIHDLCFRLDITLEIESQENKGTRIRLIFKKEQDARV